MNTKPTPDHRAFRLFRAVAIFWLFAAANSHFTPAQAATFTWDASTTGTGSDGSGTWSNGGAGNWANAGDSAWSNSDLTDNAVFAVGGTAGTITVSGGVDVGNITFNPIASGTYYTIAGNTITLTTGTITTNAASAIINSVLAGSVGLTTSGTGTLILGGANTYPGATNVNNGTLQIAGAGSLPSSSAITVGNTGALTFAQAPGSGGLTISNNISGAGVLNFSPASGAYNLFQPTGNESSFTGTVNIQPGAMTVFGSTFFGSSSTINVASGGQIYLSGGTTYSGNFVISGTGIAASSINGNGYGAISLYASTVNGTIGLAGNAMIEAGNGGSASTINAPVSLGGSTLTLSNQADNNASGAINVAGAISGSGGITIAQNTNGGAFSVTLSGSNTYTGTTTVSGGTLTLSSASGFAVPGNITFGNGSATINPTIVTTQANQFGSGTVISFINNIGGYTRLILDGNNESVGGLSDSIGAGVIENGYTSTYDPSQSGTLTINVASGSTYSYGGYLRNVDTGTGSGSTIVSLVVGGAGQQTLAGLDITYTGPTTVNSGTLALQSTTAFASGTTTVNAGATLALSNSLNGFSSRNKDTDLITGSGTINVNNAASGIGGGWVIFDLSTVGLSNFTGTINVNSGVLSMDDYTGAWSGNPELNVVSGGLFALRGQAISVDALTGNGDVFNNNSQAATLTVGAANGSGTFSGVIHGANSGAGDGTIEQGSLALIKAGTGTETLTGSNTYVGTTSIYNGTLQIGNGGTTGALAGSSAISGSSTGTLAFDLSSSGTVSNAISGAVALTQNGSGSITLTAPTYTGATTINSGTLALLNADFGSSNVTVNSGGVFNLVSTSASRVDFTKTISGAGTLEFSGTGVVYFLTTADQVTISGGINILSGGVGTDGLVATFGNDTAPLSISPGAFFDLRSANSQFDSLSGSGSVINSYMNAATLTIGVANGSATFSGDIQNGGNAVTTAGGWTAGNGTIALTKDGAGTETLSGSNSFTGGLTINGGKVQLQFANVSGTNVIAAGNALTLGGGSLSLAGNASGNTSQTLASLTVSGGNNAIALNPGASGTTTLTITSATVSTAAGSSVNFNYAGGGAGTTSGASVGNGYVAWNPTLTNGIIGGAYTVIDSGGSGFATVIGGDVLRLADPGSAGLPASGGASGNNYFINASYGTTSTSVAGSLSLAATGAVSANTVTINSNGYSSGALSLGSNEFTITAGGGILFSGTNSFSITGSGGLTSSASAGPMYLENYASGAVTISAPILANGASTLTVNGSGTTVLTGTNTYTGATSVNGSLQIGGAGQLGSTGTYSGGITDNGALAFNTSANQILSGVVSGTGSLTESGAGTLTLTSTPTYTGVTTISAGELDIDDTGTITSIGTGGIVNNGTMGIATSSGATGVLIYSNAISGTGAFTIETESSNGSRLELQGVAISNTNTWNIVNQGALWLVSTTSGTYGSAMNVNVSNANSGAYNAGSGEYFDLDGVAGTVFNIGGLSGAGQVENSGAAQTLIVGNGNATSTYSGVMSGATSLTKSGTGTLTLTGANTYTGVTTISGGELDIVSGITSFPSSGIVNNGTMGFATSGGSGIGVVTYANAISGTGTFTIETQGSTGARLNLQGVAISNTNTWNIVNQGALWLASTTSGTYGSAMNVNVSNSGGGAYNSGGGEYLELAGVAGTVFNIGALSGAGQVENNVGGGAAQTLVIGNGNTSSTYSGVMSGATSLTKTGTGTLTLPGNNTYTGATTINVGRMIVSGSLSGTVSTSVAAGATLEADGQVNLSATNTVNGTLTGNGSVGAVNVSGNGSVLAPGYNSSLNAAGALTAHGNVTLSSNSAFAIRLGVVSGTDGDQLAMSSGSVSLNGAALQLTLGPALNNPANVGLAYIIINGGAGAGAGEFSFGGNAIANDGTFSTGGFTFEVIYGGTGVGTNNIGNSTDDELVLTAIPEPGTWGMIAGGLGILIAFQRGRRARLK